MSVQIRELAPRTDLRGSSFAVGDYHVASVRPGQIRGNHFHREGRELLVVLYTDAWSLHFDSGEGTPVETRAFTGSGAVAIDIEPMSAHAIRNDGASDLHVFVAGNSEAFPRKLVEPLTRLAGLDGCPGGWLAAIEDVGAGFSPRQDGLKPVPTLEVRICRSDEELIALFRECAVVAIDIPIGLTDRGPRLCDRHARRFLGRKRASSVFPAPLRPLLALRDYADANRLSRDLQKRGITKQGWNIVPKVEQIDRILQRHHELRRRVYEVHPEVTFCAWAGEELPPKKTREGAEARRTIAKAYFGEIPPLARGMHENDLLDALAALWTAERIFKGNARELGDAHLDVTGLPMRIVY